MPKKNNASQLENKWQYENVLKRKNAFQLEACEDLDNEIDEVITEFEQNNSRRNILHTICFY